MGSVEKYLALRGAAATQPSGPGATFGPGASLNTNLTNTGRAATFPFPASITSGDILARLDGDLQAYADTAGTVPQNSIGGVVGLLREASPLVGTWIAPTNGQRVTKDLNGLRVDFGGATSPGQTLQRLQAASVPMNNSTLAFTYVPRDGVGSPPTGIFGAFPTLWGARTGGATLCGYVNGSAVDSGYVIPRAQKCTVVMRWTPTAFKVLLIVDGVTQTPVTINMTINAGTTGGSGIALGFANAGTQGLYATVPQGLVLGRAISDDEAVALAKHFDSKTTSEGFPTSALLVGISADSIGAGFGANMNDAWAYVMLNNLRASVDPYANLCNTAIGGSGVAPSMYADWSQFRRAARARNVLIIASGTNDLANNNDVTQLIADYWAAVDACRAKGDYVVACTILPRSDVMVVSQATFNARRATFNAAVRASWASHAQALADTAAVSGMGADGDSNNTTNYSVDKIHPTGTGHRLIEPVYRNAVISVL